jgi:PKD repeat protein
MVRFIFFAWVFICLTFGIGIHCFESKAQISESGIPESFRLKLKNAQLVPVMKLDSVKAGKLIEEDQKFRIENRYGIVQTCDINLKEAGVKTMIQGKGAIWQYQIQSENAYSLGLYFKKYNLPANARLFIYDSSGTRLRGAFTQQNNNERAILPIAEFPGNNLIIEYFEPTSAEFSGELVLGSISQAYLDIRKLANGRIGINCEEGKDWQVEKHSVCLMTFHDFQNSYFCTGALINNVKEDETPYFLTANHCISSESVANTLITYFNYENSNCNLEDASFSQTLSGATFKSGSSYSDFSLLLLGEYPPDEYNPYYAGWDVSGANPRSEACLHHPDGASKCIALASNTAFSYSEKIEWFSEDLRLISTTYPDSHWNVLFDQGMPEAGSSGGPLFDQNKRIVGQLHGGVNSVLLFGKLSLSWDYNMAYNEQLAHWLDPTNTRKTLNGIWKMPPKTNFRAELQEVCVSTPIGFTDKTTHKPTQWLWKIDPLSYRFTNGTDSASQNPQIEFLKDGAYSVSLHTSNKYGSDELIQKNYILARSKLDVQFRKAGKDSTICGCDLKDFPLVAGGAVSYKFKIDRPELIDTTIQANTLLLTLNPTSDYNQSFTTWVKVIGKNGNCVASDSIQLHIIIQPNDDIRNAARLHLGRNSGYSNKCATAELKEPNPSSSGCLVKNSWCPDFTSGKSLVDNSVWFSFISPTNGLVTINTYGFDDQIAVYEASAPGDILAGDRRLYSMIAANDNRSASDKTSIIENLELEPGKKYWLQVDGHNAASGNLIIDLISNTLEAVVYPNPSDGLFNLNLFHPKTGTAELSVSDLNGRILLSKQFKVTMSTTQFNFSLDGYPKGIYILKVVLNGLSLSKKLICL